MEPSNHQGINVPVNYTYIIYGWQGPLVLPDVMHVRGLGEKRSDVIWIRVAARVSKNGKVLAPGKTILGYCVSPSVGISIERPKGADRKENPPGRMVWSTGSSHHFTDLRGYRVNCAWWQLCSVPLPPECCATILTTGIVAADAPGSTLVWNN